MGYGLMVATRVLTVTFLTDIVPDILGKQPQNKIIRCSLWSTTIVINRIYHLNSPKCNNVATSQRKTYVRQTQICNAVSKNRFDLVSTIGQTFGHAKLTNGLVKVNGRNTVRNFNFNTI